MSSLPILSWRIVAVMALLLLSGISEVRAAEPGWSQIPCSQSALTTSPERTCFKGPDDNGNSGHCDFAKYSAYSGSPATATFAYAYILHGSANNCWVEQDRDFTEDFRGLLPALKEHATNWSGLTNVGAVSGMYFDFPERHCFAYDRLGPRWLEGYKDSVEGYVCGAVGKKPLTPTEIQAFVNSIRVGSR